MLKTNTVYCAECLKKMKEIDDKSIDLILTDPPYGMEFRSNYRNKKYDKIENDNNLDWLEEFITEIKRTSKEDAHIYVFCSFHKVDIFKQELEKQFKVKNILIWEKNNTGMGDLYGDYAPKYEMIIFCSNGNKKLNGNRIANIIKADKTGNTLHPTEKPLELIKLLITKSSNEDDIILDPFLGSGTTAVACKQLNRNYIGIELSEEYCEIARKRLEQDVLFS